MSAIYTSVHSLSNSRPPPSSSPVITLSSVSLFSIRHKMIKPKTKTASYSKRVVCMAPDEEKLTRRNPLDFPIEWERPKPGRRPDIFPQFSPMKTPLPPPLPYDPQIEEDEEEEEEEKKEEEEEDPDKEQPEK